MSETTLDPAALLAAASKLDDMGRKLADARATLAERDHVLDQAYTDLESERAQGEALRARITRLEKRTEAERVATARDAARPAATGPGTYPTLAAWVDGWLVVNTERSIGSKLRWCCRWHEHPEAVWRLTAAWQDFERSWANPTSGVTNFARNSLSYHLTELMAGDGPFAACSPDRHEQVHTLPTTAWS